MEEKEKVEEKIEASKSAIILKTIYAVLVVIIMINCIILISSILLKADTTPTISKNQVIILDETKAKQNEINDVDIEKELPINEENIDNSVDNNL